MLNNEGASNNDTLVNTNCHENVYSELNVNLPTQARGNLWNNLPIQVQQFNNDYLDPSMNAYPVVYSPQQNFYSLT
ncbi:hypothetical protein MXB_2642 [Myxobolus squamalis]|nr:hypothetical protein MXB_2642 [Myxobolus squamalis]